MKSTIVLLLIAILVSTANAIEIETQELEYSERQNLNNLIGKSNFEVEPFVLFLNAYKDNSTIFYINLTNDGAESFTTIITEITGNLSGKIEEGYEQLALAKKTKRQAGFEINSTETGVFEGNITFRTDGLNRTIPVVLTVSESDRIVVDARVRANVKAGRNLEGEVIINPRYIGDITVKITYGIKKLNGESLGQKQVEAQINGNTTSQLLIPVPKTAGIGDYYFYTIVEFNGRQYADSEYFNISTILKPETLFIGGFLLIIIAVVMGSMFKKKEKTLEEYKITGK